RQVFDPIRLAGALHDRHRKSAGAGRHRRRSLGPRRHQHSERGMRFRSLVLAAGLLFAATAVQAADWISPPYFAKDEASGDLPPIAERLPEHPAVATMDQP